MKQRIQQFKQHVIEASHDKNFIHHKWYVRYHLNIVEKIALELCAIYHEADKDLVLLLVWLHDYGKMMDFTNQHSATLNYGRKKLAELGFPQTVIDASLSYIAAIDAKKEINSASIEVKIVSSSDGAAHLVGPFYLYWLHENASRDFHELTASTARKAIDEWNNKIVLPEVKQAFQARQNFVLEQCGQLPSQFLS